MNDPRINFVCIDFPEFARHVDAFKEDNEVDE